MGAPSGIFLFMLFYAPVVTPLTCTVPLQIIERIGMRAVAADLKVEIIAGGPAGGPHIGNGLPLGNGIAYIDGNRGAVCI